MAKENQIEINFLQHFSKELSGGDETAATTMDEFKNLLQKVQLESGKVGKYSSADFLEKLATLAQLVDENRDIFEKFENWPSITGLSQKELDVMDTSEVINLVRQKLFLTIEKYFTLSSTHITNTTKKILNNPSRIRSPRRGQINQTENYLTKDSIITYKGNDSELKFTLERTKELFTKRMQNGSKVFNFLLQKLNEQNRQEVTKFQLIELVENGIYKNKDSAAKGLKTVLEKIFAISIEGITTNYNGRKKEKKTFIKSRIISAF